MNKRKILIISVIAVCIFSTLLILILNLSQNNNENTISNDLIVSLNDQDDSVFSEQYLESLNQQEQESAIDRQNFDNAYSNYKTSTTYTAIRELKITGNSASCLADATTETIDTTNNSTFTTKQTFRLTLIKENDSWKIKEKELLSSSTN